MIIINQHFGDNILIFDKITYIQVDKYELSNHLKYKVKLKYSGKNYIYYIIEMSEYCRIYCKQLFEVKEFNNFDKITKLTAFETLDN